MVDSFVHVSQTRIVETNFRKSEVVSIKIEMLRSFCAVAQAGNLSDAADQLGRTQSAVSMTLKQLEAHLGNSLFEGERKNRLTLLGEQVLRLSMSQISQFDNTIAAIEKTARAPQGILRITAVPSVAISVFPELVRTLAERHPSLKIELRDTDTQQVLESVGESWADIGIASVRKTLNGIKTTLLFSDQFGLVMSADHPLVHTGGPLRIADVFTHSFLRNALCDQLETPAFSENLGKADITVHNTQSLLAMVRESDWVTVLPQLVTEIAPEGLAFRTISDLPDMRNVYLYVREQTSSSRFVDEAVAIIYEATQRLTVNPRAKLAKFPV
jgi:LysR family transcriptional regulator, carnitine catabolism transcriptional activator